MRADTCNCYLSYFGDLVAVSSGFHAATTDGAAILNRSFDDFDQAVIETFLSQKRGLGYGQSTQPRTSTELYRELEFGEIRVLELHPGAFGAELQGRLHVISVDFTHPTQIGRRPGPTYTRNTNHAISIDTGRPVWYTALSYVWGVPIFDKLIHFPHKTLQITSSLAIALQHLRSREHSILLWIDQVCIDQANTREKEQQIPLMGLIYSHATNTLIWLGAEDDEDPGEAFETMAYIHSRLQMGNLVIGPDDFERLNFPPIGHQSWTSIRQLLKRSWFSRLWTIQEAVLSRSLFVQCGTAVVSWNDLASWTLYLEDSSLLRWIMSNSDVIESQPSTTIRSYCGGEVINALDGQRSYHMSFEQKPYLLDLLVSTRYAQSTVLKDKVYGVLGMAEPGIVSVDSTAKSARAVYHTACLTQLPELTYEHLSCVDHETPLELSWVPDWSVARVTQALGYLTKAWALYYAGGQVASQASVLEKNRKIRLSSDKTQLTLPGALFDTVVILGDVTENPTLDIDDPRSGNSDWASNIELVKGFFNTQDYPQQGISVYDAFWQTLIAGRDGSGAAAPTQEHSDVFSLILDSTTGEMPSLPGQAYSPRRLSGHFKLQPAIKKAS